MEIKQKNKIILNLTDQLNYFFTKTTIVRGPQESKSSKIRRTILNNIFLPFMPLT
jgi:hypothetical protein